MSEWKETALGKIGNVMSGGTPNTSIAEYWEGDILFVTPFDLSRNKSPFIANTERKISKNGLIASSANLLPIGSIIISSRAPIGYIAIGSKEFTTNQGCKSVIPNCEFDSLFLYYCLNFNVDRIKRLGAGSTFAEISKKDLEIVKFPHPKDRSEQQKIAQILFVVDSVLEKTHATITKYKAIKHGMLHDFFTRGIDITTGKLRPKSIVAPELYKESKLGMVPGEWEVQQLDQICSMKSGEGITSKSIQEMGDYPVYGGNGLRGYAKNYTHEGEYTLIGRQGALCGNITRVSGKLFASQHAVVVTAGNEIDIDWVSQKLDTMNLNQYSEASAQPGLSVSKILQLQVAKPEYDEQKMIAYQLIQIDKTLNAEQNFLHKVQKLQAGLMEDLLSGRKIVNMII